MGVSFRFFVRISLVIPGRVEDANPESITTIVSMDSGLVAKPVIGRAFARPVGVSPE
jgi:hypothetical protein